MSILSMVTTDKRIAGKAAWFVYTFCTILMMSMVISNHWPMWMLAVPIIHEILMTVLSFHPKSSPTLQSFLVMMFSFGNIFIVSIAEGTIYSTMLVFLGAGIVLAVYRDVRILVTYALLIVAGICYHIFILGSIAFTTSPQTVEFIIRTSILFISLFSLSVLVAKVNQSRDMMEESLEKARQAEQYKSDFLANMSHEIRTPMNAIIGMCELILRDETLSPGSRENGFNIQASGRSLLSIINDILDYSKIDSGKMEIVNEEFNIASVINDVINMAEARKGAKDLKVLVNVDPDLPTGLLGDEQRIRQVIINLMTNAIKFTEKGSVTLTVSHSVQDYGINLFVSVKDTGIGITEENIEHLFTSFQQVDTKKNRAVEGTGLGLAISKRLISQMGGFISVKSKYGYGSDFRFTIPLHVSDSKPFVSLNDPENIHAAACFEGNAFAEEEGSTFVEMGRKMMADFEYIPSMDELKERYAENRLTHIFVSRKQYDGAVDFLDAAAKEIKVFLVQERSDTAPLSEDIHRVYSPFYVIPVVSAINQESIVINLNERRAADTHFIAPDAKVLLVDDNGINLKVAMGLMQPYNMNVVTTTSGPEAIEMLTSADFDIIFMDHMMPGMDGVEATAIIREMDGDYYKNVPIIALTANVANGAREMFLQSGFDDFLGKPIELSSLDRVLRNHLPREYLKAPTRPRFIKPAEPVPEVKEPSILDTELGISYMGGLADVYKEILALYADTGAEKIELINELFEKKDIKNYVIEVHALKSTSLNAGAEKLSEMAKELELAGKADKLDDSWRPKHDAMLELYKEVIDAAREYLGTVAAPQDAPESSDEPTELTEITADVLRGYLDRAKAACSSFDGDTLAAIAAKAAAQSYGGEPLKDYFGRAAQLASDFEYEAAEEELSRLEAKLEG